MAHDLTVSKLLLEGNIPNPYFSIIIPTYNRKEELIEAIQSAIEQKGINDISYEIIIVDNKPYIDDDSTNIGFINHSIEDTSKIYYYVNYNNIGGCKNWNQGYDIARGKWIIMLHDDDLLCPTYLLTLSSIIKKYNKVDAITFSPYVQNKLTNTFQIEYTLQKTTWIRPLYLMLRNRCNVAGVALKKEIWVETGGFNVAYSPIFDYEFWYRISKGYNFLYYKMQNPCTIYNIGINDSTNPDTTINVIKACLKLQQEIAQKEPFLLKQLHKSYQRYNVNKTVDMNLKKFLINSNNQDKEKLESLKNKVTLRDKFSYYALSGYVLIKQYI